jgi:hypothetical protein
MNSNASGCLFFIGKKSFSIVYSILLHEANWKEARKTKEAHGSRCW